ncbi:MAG: alanine racemase, partial [Acidobacteriota bacterium]|nr:alanine racemase [Acidobacteriota bacterium]
MTPPYRSWVYVSREQIARNYRAVREVAGAGVEVAGVVKADAYGHGALEVSRVLIEEGARWLAVSSVDEGVQLRAGGITATRILVMGGFVEFECGALVEHDLTPAIHSLDQLARFDRLAAAAGRPLRYHLKIDSGMGRLGTRAGGAEIATAVHAAPHARMDGLMTHFASAADYTSPQTDEQLACFHSICDQLAAAGIRPPLLHTSSTIPIAYGRRAGWHTLVRAGHALYGYISPARGEAPAPLLHVLPALTWKARLLAVKDIP